MKTESNPGAPDRRIRLRARRWLALALLISPAYPAWSQDKAVDLTTRSLEDLMNIQVTSVSKKEQKMSQVAAAVFVITQEDIRRSGSTNIPDLLRMVPGLDVAQINGNTWAITARGFNLQFANKLLVLIDGRAVYSPLFGGVNWDTQDVPFEDIDRIEVIRGPGGAIWGANAVNGVINIITKKAKDTSGALLTGGGGTQGQSFGTAQYGGQINADTSYRIFTKYLNVDHSPDLTGQDAEDGWHLLHGGFRIDTSPSTNDSLTIQGDLYAGSEGASIVHTSLNPPENVTVERVAPLSGGNILGRWQHNFSSRSDTTLQFYFDRYTRSGPNAREVRDTVDLDFQHHLALGSRHDLIWGLDLRHTADQIVGNIDEAFVPARRADGLISGFIQDQITLKPDRVFLSLGTKLENNYFSGFDFEPSARVAWTPSHRHTFWAAISRAARTPTRRDLNLNTALAAFPRPVEVVLLGNPEMKSEHVEAFELGYRAQPAERFSLDVAAFFNTYQDLESVEQLPPVVQLNPPLTIRPQTFGNKLHGTTDGIEFAANWKVTGRWTLSPGYSLLQMHLHSDSANQGPGSSADIQGLNPVHQAQLRSHLELVHGFSWDTSAYFVNRLPEDSIPSYTRLDSQLSWRITERMDLSLVGQNLLRDHHAEFNDELQALNSSLVKRSGYAKFTWRF